MTPASFACPARGTAVALGQDVRFTFIAILVTEPTRPRHRITGGLPGQHSAQCADGAFINSCSDGPAHARDGIGRKP